MVFHYHPRAILNELISRIIIVQYKLNKHQPCPVNPYPPLPEHSLIFYLRDRVASFSHVSHNASTLPRSIFVGPQLSRVDLTLGHDVTVVNVVFQPCGMHRLLGLPMHEMINRYFESSQILGKELGSLTDHLGELEEPDEIASEIQTYFLTRATKLKQPLPMDKALAQWVNFGKAISVDTLASYACLGVRQLERNFQNRIGMGPKEFTKLVRFSRAWRMRELSPGISWGAIAYACGYADQMHMIRDFKHFSGATPTLMQNDLEKSPLRLQADSWVK